MGAALSIIVASSGRPSLHRTLESIHGQAQRGDEILVSVNADCPWGHAARNQLIGAARGDAVMFMDDDDAYVPGALDAVRGAVDAEPERMHLFQMRYADGRVLWDVPQVACGHVSTQMVVVPNRPELTRARWTDRYEGDYDFIAAAAGLFGAPVFHDTVIALIRPADGVDG